jgi:hypothetical protein
VTLPEIAGLLRRHVLAVLAVLVVVLGVAYSFKHTAPTYAETATITIVPPVSGVHPNAFTAVGGALSTAAGAIATTAMSYQSRQQVLGEGGTAQIDVEPVNSYDLEYPNYSSPYLTVTTTSTDFSAVHHTFTLVNNLITSQVMARQVQDNVTPNNQLQLVVSGDTGPLLEQGSSKRALGALVILALVAVFGVATFLDRHPPRLIRSFRKRMPEERSSRTRLPRIRQADSAAPDY